MIAYKKRIIAVSAVCLLFLVLGFILYPRDTDQSEYIFDKTYDIRLRDVTQSRSALPRQQTPPRSDGSILGDEDGASTETDPEFDLKALFSEGLINAHTTLKYFKHLEHHFRKTTTLGEHFEKIRDYLFSHFPGDEAQVLFDTYQIYLQCEMDLLDEYKNFSAATTTEEALAVLRRIQDFRRERMGRDLADNLFGADVKAKEYAFRRAAIVNDDKLYGDEKEKRIGELNTGMWGEEAGAVEEHPNPYNRYQEKLKIYEKDLSGLSSDGARQEKIRTFREAFFPPETIEKLEAVDRQILEAEAREQTYMEAETQILKEPGLTDIQKEEKIRQLQDLTFGEDAESFRRREAIVQGKEALIMENQQKAAGMTE